MHKVSKLIIVVVFILSIALLMSTSFYKNNVMVNKGEEQTYFYNGNKNIECLYYNTADFLNVKEYNLNKDAGTIHGCIVPHHLLAKDLIHEVFQNIKKDEYKTVVLIGPDHESVNKGKIFTTLSDYQTPMGILETDDKITSELLKNSFIIANDEKLTKEHSTSSIVPFIKNYLDDVKVITLVLTKQVTLEDIDLLVEKLYENVNMDETLFIASVDFSHYLDLDNANKMDLISMDAIKNKDIKRIMTFNNDNLDSPNSVVTMLKMMDKAKLNGNVLNNSNSELILKDNINETTSYITYLFY